MTDVTIPRAWIDGAACYVPDLAVHELFLLRARHDPDALAVRQWGTRLSYRELASAAVTLAGRLRAAGAGPAARVGICMRRIPWLVASELAVLIAGGTFVPLDLDQPGERLRAIAEDAGIEFALVDSAGAELLAGVVGQLIAVDSGSDETALDAVGEFGSVAPRDVAYIMYTSGSTGRPKGAMISHGNLAAFAAAANQHLGGTVGYRQAAFAAIGFDVSVYEFFAPLVCGSSIHLVPEGERADAERLQRFLEAHGATRVFLPPVLLPLLDPGRLAGLREIIVGGEPCDPRQVGRWAVAGVRRFYNWYGPTEATVAVVGTELSGPWDRPLPIGQPMPGCRAYVLDDRLTMCAAGQAGELFVGGPQVGLGYVSSPEENAGRFVPDPFRGSAPGPAGAGVLYRTGDLAKWDENGVIWFLGRVDRQVQIHGRRVEPGEIETVLAGHPRVAQAVVDVAGSAVRAYVTPEDAPPSDELRQYCAAWLPRHMVPASVTALARLPMTVNAKVDFAALRQFGPPAAAEPDAAELVTGFERAVGRIWAALFGVASPGLDADFLLAGGDSLSAMRLASALRQTTGRDVAAADVLDGRTVGGIAARVGAAGTIAGATLPTGSAAALSQAQRRMWFVEQFAPGVPVHNIVMSEQLAGALDVAALERAFEDVAERQAALRWQLRPGDGLPMVTVADPVPVRIPVSDLSVLPAAARQPALSGLLDDEAHTPIDLTTGLPWRVRLLRLDEEAHVLLITVHHIVFDGWSQAILYRELGEAYQRRLAGQAAPPAPPAPVTFADYTRWTLDQAERNAGPDTQWWERHLSAAPSVLDLPRDRPRPAVLSFGGAVRGNQVTAELAAGITRLAVAEGTTPSAVLLAAFSLLLRRLTGQRDLVIGIPVADRGHAEFEQLIGFFIRSLPVRVRVDDQAAFAEHVRACSNELASARQHADAPLERIVEALGVGRDLTRNPLFQVMFNVYNFDEPHLKLGDAVAHPLRAGVPGSLVDLTVYVIFRDGGMHLEAAYNSDLYDGPRIDALLASYRYLLGGLIRHPHRSMTDACARPDASRLPDWTAPLPNEIPDRPGLLEQVRAAARAVPGAVAVEDADRTLSYGDVLRVIDGTAAALRAAPAGTGDAVAVLAERTAILPAVLLGVLSTGARWAVIDSELPAAALHRRISAVSPRAVILCGGNAAAAAASLEVPVIDAARLAADGIAADPAGDVPAAFRGYLSFTSGTTGEPQLIDTSEAPLVHFLNWYRATFGLDRRARFAMLSGVAYDPLLRDMFTPLSCGGTLAVPPAGLLRDPSRLLAWLDQSRITVVHTTPQLARMMAAGSDRSRRLESLRLVAVGGDQLTEGDAAALRLIAPDARVLNFYGTTETPQAQAYFEVPAPAQIPDQERLSALRTMPVPVGAGIDGAQLLVMSSCGRPAAVGELGEVIIRSLHLSNGYAGQALAVARFVSLPGAGEGRVYRTGDLGRYSPSGAVSLAGRADDQVKVRGFRVELGEVEAALCAHPDVERAAVRLFDRDGASALHAYAVARGPAIAGSDVLQRARALLPPYAVPSGITFLRTLPLTGAGKVDRAMLPPPGHESPAASATDDPSTGHFERLVLAIWREVLGRPRIGSNDNFFEIGGHSMAIIEVQARLKRSLGRQVHVVDLFRFPTIRSLAGHLASGDADARLTGASTRGHMRRQRAGRPRPRAGSEGSSADGHGGPMLAPD